MSGTTARVTQHSASSHITNRSRTGLCVTYQTAHSPELDCTKMLDLANLDRSYLQLTPDQETFLGV